MPGGTLGKAYRPASLVTVVVVELVEISVSLTLAPGTAAPCWSVTWPASAPLAAFWAKAGVANRLSRSEDTPTYNSFLVGFIPFPPFQESATRAPRFAATRQPMKVQTLFWYSIVA